MDSREKKKNPSPIQYKIVPIYRDWVHMSASVFGKIPDYPPPKQEFSKITLTKQIFLNICMPHLTTNQTNVAATIHFWVDTSDDVSYMPTTVQKAAHSHYSKAFPKANVFPFLNQTSQAYTKIIEQMKEKKPQFRVLYHYYSYGTPPTEPDSIWFSSADQKKFEKLSFSDFLSKTCDVTAYIFDCDNSGMYLPHFKNLKDTFAFFSVSAGEMLPRSCGLPGDLFTSCIITPARMALLWHSRHYFCFKNGPLKPLTPFFTDDILDESILDEIYANIMTMLKHLVEAMAFSAMPKKDFQHIFRTDQTITQIATNFILAQRIFSFFEKKPVSHPAIPDLTKHVLWHTFDLRLDAELFRLMNPSIPSIPFSTYLSQVQTALDNAATVNPDKRAFFPEVSFVPSMLARPETRESACSTLAKFLDRSPECVSNSMNFQILHNMFVMMSQNVGSLPLMFCVMKFACLEPQIISTIFEKFGTYIDRTLTSSLQSMEYPTIPLITLTILARGYPNGPPKLSKSPVMGAVFALLHHRHRDVRVWATLFVSVIASSLQTEEHLEEIFRRVKMTGTDDAPEIVLSNLYCLSCLITGSSSEFQLRLLLFIDGFRTALFYKVRCQVLSAMSIASEKRLDPSKTAGPKKDEIDNLIHTTLSELAGDPHPSVSINARAIIDSITAGKPPAKESNILDSYFERVSGEIHCILDRPSELMPDDFVSSTVQSRAQHIQMSPFKSFSLGPVYTHPCAITSNLAYVDLNQVVFGDEQGYLNTKVFGDAKLISRNHVSSSPIVHTDAVDNCGFPLIFLMNARGVCQAYSRTETELRLCSAFKTDPTPDNCARSFDIDGFSGQMISYRVKNTQALPIIDLRGERVVYEMDVGGRVKHAAWAGEGSQMIGVLAETETPLFQVFDVRTKMAAFQIPLDASAFDFRATDFSSLEFIIAQENGSVEKVTLISTSDVVKKYQISPSLNAMSFSIQEATDRCLVGHQAGISLLELNSEKFTSFTNVPKLLRSGAPIGPVTNCLFHPTKNAMNIQNAADRIATVIGQNENE